MLAIGVDIGGMFTDIVGATADGHLVFTKVSSTPANLVDGVRRGVEALLQQVHSSTGQVSRFIHGTMVATNAILERKGAIIGLLATEGFEDVLEIGRQRRSCMYDLDMDPETPTFLAPRRRRLGIRERVDRGWYGVASTRRTPGHRDDSCAESAVCHSGRGCLLPVLIQKSCP